MTLCPLFTSKILAFFCESAQYAQGCLTFVVHADLRVKPALQIGFVGAEHVKEFLTRKHKVRIRIVFRGRELAHKEFADRLLVKILQETASIGKIDRDAHMLGKSLLLILCPK